MVDVVDASVAIKWFVIEPGREAALDVLSRFVSSPTEICVPELFYFELTHVFGRLIKKPTAAQIKLVEFVLTQGVHRFSHTPELYRLQRRYQSLGLSGYDATYVAVAELVKGRWITFDAQAHKKIARKKLSHLLIAD